MKASPPFWAQDARWTSLRDSLYALFRDVLPVGTLVRRPRPLDPERLAGFDNIPRFAVDLLKFGGVYHAVGSFGWFGNLTHPPTLASVNVLYAEESELVDSALIKFTVDLPQRTPYENLGRDLTMTGTPCRCCLRPPLPDLSFFASEFWLNVIDPCKQCEKENVDCLIHPGLDCCLMCLRATRNGRCSISSGTFVFGVDEDYVLFYRRQMSEWMKSSAPLKFRGMSIHAPSAVPAWYAPLFSSASGGSASGGSENGDAEDIVPVAAPSR